MTNYEPSLDTLFNALGDPTRRAVVSRLAHSSATVSELAEPHDMALPTFLGHLKKLEQAGLIATLKRGRVRHCTLRPEALLPVRGWLDAQRAIWETRLDQFDDYVLQLAKDRENDRP